jgi:hypothetical protein
MRDLIARTLHRDEQLTRLRALVPPGQRDEVLDLAVEIAKLGALAEDLVPALQLYLREGRR